MRDTLLLLVIVLSLLAAARYPFAGLIVWAWYTLMTPHQLTYDAFGVPLNTLIAGITVIAIFVHGAVLQFRVDRMSILLGLFALWLFVSQYFSLNPNNSAVYFDRFFKTIIFAFLCVQMATTRLRIHALIWTMVLSIGFFAAKGAIFTLVTLGEYRVQGMENTLLEDNNHMGIAMATSLPLILYLRSQVTSRTMQYGLTALFALTILSIIGTHSRGAFLCLIVFGGFFWVRSKYKVLSAIALLVLAIPAIAFMPSKWTDRMATISDATEDDSFMGRVDAWVINTKVAVQNPVTGAGLRNPYLKDIAEDVVSEERAANAKAAHSIYFEVLGGSGFIGLGIYLSLLGGAGLTTFRLQRARLEDGLNRSWIQGFGRYAQMALVIFGVGGASVSMEMWDGYLILVALIGGAAFAARQQHKGVRTLRADRRSWRSAARGHTIKPRPAGA